MILKIQIFHISKQTYSFKHDNDEILSFAEEEYVHHRLLPGRQLSITLLSGR